MINRLFQYYWYTLVKPFIPRKNGDGTLIEHYSARMKSKMSQSQTFGKPKYAVFGDSNGEKLDKRDSMIQLGDGLGLILNFAVSGMRGDSWLKFLTETADGKWLYDQLMKLKIIVIWNIGGNHVLQNRMDNLQSSLVALKTLFPDSFNCLIPPIHAGLMETVGGMDAAQIRQRVMIANQTISDIWKEKAIDTYSPFLAPDASGEPYFFVLQDFVHFSDFADRKFRIPIIIKAVKNA